MVSIVNFLPYFLMKSGSSVRAELTLPAAVVLSTSNQLSSLTSNPVRPQLAKEGLWSFGVWRLHCPQRMGGS